MDKTTQIEEISSLILKDIKQDISDLERAKLQNWLNESNENRELFERMCNQKFVLQQYELRKNVDTNKAWKKCNKITCNANKKRHHIIGYAATVAVLIASTAAIYFTILDPTHRHEGNSQVAENQNDCKVHLITDDNQTIALGKESSLIFSDSMGTDCKTEHSTLFYANSRATVEVMHTLVVDRGGEYSVKLSDGTVVYLNSESRISYPISFIGNIRKVRLEGEAYFEVAKNASKPFIVEGQNFSVRVLGTSFNISAYKEDNISRIALVEGSVQVDKDNKSYKLTPNHVLEISGTDVNISEINAQNAISWRGEDFYFSNERLEMVMARLSRWYNVNFVFKNNNVKDFHFTGFIPKYEDITKSLNLLELASGVKFDIRGSTVIIRDSY